MSVVTNVSAAVKSENPFGVVTVSVESLVTLTFTPVTDLPALTLNLTALTDAAPPCMNPPPVTVRAVPPFAGPVFGVTELTNTAALYWNAVAASAFATTTGADGGRNW